MSLASGRTTDQILTKLFTKEATEQPAEGRILGQCQRKAANESKEACLNENTNGFIKTCNFQGLRSEVGALSLVMTKSQDAHIRPVDLSLLT